MAITHTLVSALPDNAADAAAGLVVSSDWNADHAVTSIQIATGTITASEPAVDITQTWNNATETFTGWKLNVTNTACAAGSLVADLQFDGMSIFSVDRYSFTYLRSTYQPNHKFLISPQGLQISALVSDEVRMICGKDGYYVESAAVISWSDTYTNIPAGTQTVLLRDATGVLAQRNGTNAQTSRIYGTYTDSSNYVRASLAATSTAVTLAAETAGTGADNVPVNITPAGTEGVVIGNFAQLTEMTAPAAGAANTARLFCEDNGAGKTRLMVQFASGSPVQVAIEV